MNEVISFLTQAKILIRNGKRIINRKNYIQDLLDIGIININIVWETILSLTIHDWVHDYKPTYYINSEAFVFKRLINGYQVYIKLSIELNNNEDYLVCISFHKDW